MPGEIRYPALFLSELEFALYRHSSRLSISSFSEPMRLREMSRAAVQQTVPQGPGCYVWTHGAESLVAYIGSSNSILRRLRDYRGWLACYDPEIHWVVTVVHMLHALDAQVQWIETASHADALELEARLIEWHRACVGSAPAVVGWDVSRASRRGAAQTWARQLADERSRSQGAADVSTAVEASS